MLSKRVGIILLVFYLSLISIVISMSISLVYGQETPYNKTYLDQWIAENGCNCTHKAMEDAARLIDSMKQTP